MHHCKRIWQQPVLTMKPSLFILFFSAWGVMFCLLWGCQVFKCSIIHFKKSLCAVFPLESFQSIPPSSELWQLTVNQQANKTITFKTLKRKRVQKSFRSFWIHPTPEPGLSQLVSLHYKSHYIKPCIYFWCSLRSIYFCDLQTQYHQVSDLAPTEHRYVTTEPIWLTIVKLLMTQHLQLV